LKKFLILVLLLGGCVIMVTENYYPEIPSEESKSAGFTEVNYEFSVKAEDPDTDDVSVKMDFGDGTVTEWSPYKPSGSIFTFSHTYHSSNLYIIYIKIRDEWGNETDWNKFKEFKVYDVDKKIMPSSGFAGVTYNFQFAIIDPVGEIITLYVDWGDNDSTTVSQFVDNDFNLSHRYMKKGNYEIKIRIEDSENNLTEWYTLHNFSAFGYVIKLTWGSVPSDLDAYLFLPSGDTVYYGNTGDTAWYPYALLKGDVSSGYGPEEIVISALVSGDYIFAVKDYSGDGTITQSGAHVDVYYTTDLTTPVYQFDVPNVDSEPFWWWIVFEIDGTTGQITELNYVQNAGPVKRKKFLTSAYCGYK